MVGLYACGYTAVTVQGDCECHNRAECARAACRASNMRTALHARSSPSCEPAGCRDLANGVAAAPSVGESLRYVPCGQGAGHRDSGGH